MTPYHSTKHLLDRLSDGASAMLAEAGALLRLAAPLILTALVNMGMSLTDVVMIGWLGATELAASAAISDLYSLVFYLALGVLAALSPLVAQARGARSPREVRRTTRQGFRVALVLMVPGGILIWHSDLLLRAVGVQPEIVVTGAPYARMMALALAPMLGVAVWRFFLAAHGQPRVIFYVTLMALPLNAVGNYLLMFGAGGLPALGLAGAGLSTLLVALFLFAALTVYVLRHRRLRRYHLFVRFHKPDWPRFARIVRLGVPIGLTHLGEMGVFLFATVIVGTLGVEALAAHTVTLRTCGLLFAIPLGLSQAATVRIGYALGAGRTDAALLAGRTALLLALAAGVLYLLLLSTGGGYIAGLFLDPAATPQTVFAASTLLLGLLAIMMPFDCLGTVAGGVLRGHQDTRAPMLISLAGFWGLGFCGGLLLAFPLELGVFGIWLGLVTGTIVVTVALLIRLQRPERSAALAAAV